MLFDDIHRLLQSHLPDAASPCFVFLGGSQVLQGGALATKNSDYDILAFYEHVDTPASYCISDSESGRKYDLMVRDSETFAYDIELSRQRGRGTLIHLTAFGECILDNLGGATAFQNTVKAIYKEGPYVPHPDDVALRLSAYRQTLSDMKSQDGNVLLAMDMVNKMGRDALRYSGHWTSTGKILGRFLLEKLPDFKIRLETAYDACSQFGDVSLFDEIVNKLFLPYTRAYTWIVRVQRKKKHLILMMWSRVMKLLLMYPFVAVSIVWRLI